MQPAQRAAALSSSRGAAQSPHGGIQPLTQCRRLAERPQPGNAAVPPQATAAAAAAGSAQQQLRLKTRLTAELHAQNRQLAGDAFVRQCIACRLSHAVLELRLT